MHMLLDLKPTEILTFKFGCIINEIEAQQRISKFLNMLQRKCLGPRWHLSHISLRPRCIGFLEHKEINPHYHVLVNSTKTMGRAFRRYGAELWQRCAPRGQLDAQHIECVKDVVSYCTKAQIDLESFESPFIYLLQVTALPGRPVRTLAGLVVEPYAYIFVQQLCSGEGKLLIC